MKKAILTALMILAGAALAQADGALIIRPQPWMPPSPLVNVKYHTVDVQINDPVALTKVDQVFSNPFDREIEADYIFPIPENAAISRFVAWLGGHKMEAELLDAAQARRIYEDIVRRRKDPALLEYAGRGMYRMRVYPIPAHGDVRIQIEYEQTLKSDNGTVEYLYPLNTEKYSGANLEDCKVSIEVNSFEKIGTLYCPTHTVTTQRYGEKTMTAIYEEKNIRPNKDLVIYFTRQNRDFGFHLLSYKEPGTDNGYFLGILSPPLESRLQNIDKNVVFILDSSGSMRGEKFRQAIDALKFCLQDLNAGDNFNVIDYDDTVRPFKNTLIRADKANIANALTFADRVEASGGTDINGALGIAFDEVKRSNIPTYVIFLTDGQPTVGITNLEEIIKNASVLNSNQARLFVFGVGYDVNTHLLDRLSQENHGSPEYVTPEENIEVKISRLASKISHPALTDVALSFSSGNAFQFYPAPLPDLFYGSEIVITGRYEDMMNSTAVIHGKVGSKDVTYEFPVNFPDGSSRDDFIALLWANRRIAFLIQEIRLHGSNDELITEVIELSKKYGIITEYTSFLVSGDEYADVQRRLGRTARPGEIGYMMDAPQLMEAMKGHSKELSREQSGKSAVGQSRDLQSQSYALQAPAPGSVTVRGEAKKFENVTQVGAQGFYQVGKNWIQGDLKSDKIDMQIKRYSSAYFQILEKNPALGKYLSLGDEVRLRVGTQVVQIADTGKESLTESELSTMFPR